MTVASLSHITEMIEGKMSPKSKNEPMLLPKCHRKMQKLPHTNEMLTSLVEQYDNAKYTTVFAAIVLVSLEIAFKVWLKCCSYVTELLPLWLLASGPGLLFHTTSHAKAFAQI